MLSRKTPNAASAPRGGASLLFAEVTVRGDLIVEGDVQFDGRIEGDLRAVSLTLGEGAHVQGEVIAECVRVCGTVEGTIRADRVELAATAVVRGDVLHAALRVEDGARIDGRVCCLENPTRRTEPGKGAKGAAKDPAKDPAKDRGKPEAAARAEPFPTEAVRAELAEVVGTRSAKGGAAKGGAAPKRAA